jgi:hypothetical protein
MTHDITEARVEAVAMAIYDLAIWNARDIARAALEADARWLEEQNADRWKRLWEKSQEGRIP